MWTTQLSRDNLFAEISELQTTLILVIPTERIKFWYLKRAWNSIKAKRSRQGMRVEMFREETGITDACVTCKRRPHVYIRPTSLIIVTFATLHNAFACQRGWNTWFRGYKQLRSSVIKANCDLMSSFAKWKSRAWKTNSVGTVSSLNCTTFDQKFL